MAQRLGLAGIAEASDDIFQPRWRKRLGQPQQDALRRVLDDELGTRRPTMGVADGLWQDHPPFRGKSGFLHGRLFAVRFSKTTLRPTKDHGASLVACEAALRRELYSLAHSVIPDAVNSV
jgi:hypothetical protein